MAYNPYEAESAKPMSEQQATAVKGLGPLAGNQPGLRRDPFLDWKPGATSPFSVEAISQVPDPKFTPGQIVDLYNVADAQGRVNEGNENIFKKAFDKSVREYGLNNNGNNEDSGISSNNTGIVINLPEQPTYSRVAKPLSADILQAFGQRRLAADQAYQNALAQEESGIGRFRASFNAAKERLDNEYEKASERLARSLAGRGLARSPMLRGRGERELGQNRADQLGEMQFDLTTEIEGLKQASEQARIQRELILAQIEQDEALARSQSFDYIRT